MLSTNADLLSVCYCRLSMFSFTHARTHTHTFFHPSTPKPISLPADQTYHATQKGQSYKKNSYLS